MMNPLQLERGKVLEQFDNLVAQKRLFWKPSKPVSLIDHDIPFHFRIVPSTKTKPSFPESHSSSGTSTPQSVSTKADGLSAEVRRSDIDNGDPAFHIADVQVHGESTHRLIQNKFCIFRPQYILLTKSPAYLQTSPLTEIDLSAAWLTLQSLCRDRPHYLIFNCGKAAGGSRLHKHMQIFEMPEETQNLLPDVYISEGKTVEESALPYELMFEQHDLESEAKVEDAGSRLAEIYGRHVAKTRELLEAHGSGDTADDEENVAHNIVLTRTSLTTIPRRDAGVGPATANAAGMLGLVWVTGDDVLQLWKELGPASVLATLGVPNGKVDEVSEKKPN